MGVLAYAVAAVVLSQHGIHDLKGFTVDSGRLSVYRPNDGFNHGKLSCGGTLTYKSNHIAYRKWRKVGCGRPVLVCAAHTDRCVWSKVMDAGPFGIYKGSLRNCVRDGRWRVWTKSWTAPKGWKFRGVADLSWGLWVKLGRPKFLTKVTLYFPPKGWVKGSDKQVACVGGVPSF